MTKEFFKIGHRGARAYEPENTIRSFKRALDLGVNAIEYDLRQTKDRKIIVIHDDKVDRTTNGKGLVKDFTLKQIKDLDSGKGEKVPTFEEVLALKANYLFPLYSFTHTANVEKAHENNLKVIVWTVNDAEKMKEYIKKGVDGIATDKPDLFKGLKI